MPADGASLEAAVPEIVAVPSPLSVKVRPLGSEPAVLASAAAGEPVVVTVKVFATPVVKVVALELVNAGATPGLVTVSVKPCSAWPAAEVALSVSGKSWLVAGGTVAAETVPEIVAVPSPLSVKVSPAGSEPVFARAAAGEPVVVTVKVLTTPVVKVVALALVKAGAVPGLLTVSVKACSAGPAAEVAFRVNG